MSKFLFEIKKNKDFVSHLCSTQRTVNSGDRTIIYFIINKVAVV